MVERIDKSGDTGAEFEQHLREQLRVRSAPGGFADRVMVRAESRTARRPASKAWLGFSLPVWRWAVAAALIAGVILGGVEREHQQRLAGERAREQVLFALHITGVSLRNVQQKVNTTTTQNPERETPAQALHQDQPQ